VTWIRTEPELRDLVRSLEGCRAIGLDTESDSLYHYRDKVCLLQVASDRGAAFLVDSLAVDLATTASASPRSSTP
jgi:ribonuclease D